MTDEIVRELAGLVRWEPGMADVEGFRVASVDADGFLLLVRASSNDADDDDVMWCQPKPGALPDLTDDSTLDVLWGQLRRRFAACGWTRWSRGIVPKPFKGQLLDVRSSDGIPGAAWCLNTEVDTLLAGYRRVVELEREVGDGK